MCCDHYDLDLNQDLVSGPITSLVTKVNENIFEFINMNICAWRQLKYKTMNSGKTFAGFVLKINKDDSRTREKGTHFLGKIHISGIRAYRSLLRSFLPEYLVVICLIGWILSQES